jgi:putative FmdB family regulatory protein
MPFYEYECPSCKHAEEVLQKITDKAIGKCPSCGKRGYQRLVSAPVFRLKGKGWYETDFKSDKDNQRNLVGNEVEPKAEAKPETKPETKIESKTDAKADAKADTKADAKPESKSESKAESKPAAESGQSKNKRKSTPVKRVATPVRKHK